MWSESGDILGGVDDREGWVASSGQPSHLDIQESQLGVSKSSSAQCFLMVVDDGSLDVGFPSLFRPEGTIKK